MTGKPPSTFASQMKKESLRVTEIERLQKDAVDDAEESAVFAPIPRANVTRATTVIPGLLAQLLAPNRRSDKNVCMHVLPLFVTRILAGRVARRKLPCVFGTRSSGTGTTSVRRRWSRRRVHGAHRVSRRARTRGGTRRSCRPAFARTSSEPRLSTIRTPSDTSPS